MLCYSVHSTLNHIKIKEGKGEMTKNFGTRMEPREGFYLIAAVVGIIWGIVFFASGFRFINTIDTLSRWIVGGGGIIISANYILRLWRKGKIL